MPDPTLTHVFTLTVAIGRPVDHGETGAGRRRVIPITGGTFEGPDIRGEVLAGGADWQLTRPDGVTEVEAIYDIRTDDGAVIHVVNRGIVAPAEGGPPYVRTAPRFDAPRGRYDWLNRCLFAGTLKVANAERTAVEIGVWRID
ncbi:MAG: DUF3237 family protein [Caulobacter sp.]|nr:DUF3237 family protein [Caulobacter sp.]